MCTVYENNCIKLTTIILFVIILCDAKLLPNILCIQGWFLRSFDWISRQEMSVVKLLLPPIPKIAVVIEVRHFWGRAGSGVWMIRDYDDW